MPDSGTCLGLRTRQKLLRLHDPQRKQPWTIHRKPRRLRPAGRVVAAPHSFVPPALTVPCGWWSDCRWSTRSFCRGRSRGFTAAAGEDFPGARGKRRRRAAESRNVPHLPARDVLSGATTTRTRLKVSHGWLRISSDFSPAATDRRGWKLLENRGLTTAQQTKQSCPRHFRRGSPPSISNRCALQPALR